MYTLPFRQVHLDFHTSEKIVAVGNEFDSQEFAETLARAKVNSITCFSKCHHGLIYHETKLGARHPHLAQNLLGEQIEACHRRGIKVPVYISVGLDEFMLAKHQDWQVVGADGRLSGPAPTEAGYHLMCFNNDDYLSYLEAEIDEVFEMFPVDGLFFDIIGSWNCACRRCRAGMEAKGLDFLDADARRVYSDAVTWELKERLTSAVRRNSPDCGIFFNSGHVGPHWRREGRFFSHLELESLPSGGWGYDHFPVTARYARNLGVEFLGMTGKFQTTWGDFGSFKNTAALEYECFTALALGGRCSVGDQLHPSGRLTEATYRLIADVYSGVEMREPWCIGATPVVDVAVVNPEAIGKAKGRVDDSIAGAYRVLKEGFHQFDVIDTESDLSKYKVVILPDIITLDEAYAAKLDQYIAGGGKLLASYESGLRADLSGFALGSMGVDYQGVCEFEKPFVAPATEAMSHGVPPSEHVIYERGMKVSPKEGTEVIIDLYEPYFNRTALHFCSHQHAPVDKKSLLPAATKRDGIVYFVHPIFGLYKRYAVKTYKQLLLNALSLLLPEVDRSVRATAPSTAEFTLNRQAAQNCTVLHALHYIPIRRADRFDVIEEAIPIFDVAVWVKLEKKPSYVSLEPQGEPLAFIWDGTHAGVTIPHVKGHQMVVFKD